MVALSHQYRSWTSKDLLQYSFHDVWGGCVTSCQLWSTWIKSPSHNISLLSITHNDFWSFNGIAERLDWLRRQPRSTCLRKKFQYNCRMRRSASIPSTCTSTKKNLLITPHARWKRIYKKDFWLSRCNRTDIVVDSIILPHESFYIDLLSPSCRASLTSSFLR